MSDAPPAERACPKCGKPRRAEGEEACARCGLVFALWSPERTSEAPRLDETGEALWSAAADRFAEEARHESFIKHCAATGALAAAGARYRGWLDAHPGDAVAERMQARIVGLMTVQLGAMARGAAPARRSLAQARWFWGVLVLCGFGGLVAALLWR
jgi:uncharacterized Zn finger protein (UPF0148 family)